MWEEPLCDLVRPTLAWKLTQNDNNDEKYDNLIVH